MIERHTTGAGVRIGDGSLYDWLVEEIATQGDGEELVEELTAAMSLLKMVREGRRFAGVAEAAFDAVAREQATKKRRTRKRPRR